MNDAAGEMMIVATILATTLFRVHSINSLRLELLGSSRYNDGSLHSGMASFRSEVMTKLNSIHNEMRELHSKHICHNVRISNLEQNQK